MHIINDMQSPQEPWNAPPLARRTKEVNLWLVGLGGVAVVCLLICGGGGLFLYRAGISDVIACSDLTASGEYKKAIPHCRATVAKLPQSAASHNNLGWCLVLDGQTEEGLMEARKAIEIEPSRTYYDTLAMALALSGQGQEALKIEAEQGMINGEVANDSERVTLGMVYYAVGRKPEAFKQWQTARASTNLQAQKLARKFEAKYR